MADLRDRIHGRPIAADEAVYLAYHDGSPWARAKLEAGLRLNPESVAFMQKELDRRKMVKDAYDAELAKENKDATQNAGTGSAPPVSHDERQQPADGVRGPESDAPPGGG